MPPFILQQFGSMRPSRWSLGKDARPSPKQKVIHEEVTYPRITLAPDNNSCLNSSMSYEHVLVCGHIIATPRPDEPCAPNCHHIASERLPKRKKKDASKESKALEFYCDACVETENEALISHDITSTAAEHMRLGMRPSGAEKRGKQKNFRKCYIGLKVTSVPCHSDGTVRGRYTPRTNHHPLDTAIPQTGDNFFEDVLIIPTERLNSASDIGTNASAPVFTDCADVNSSSANLGEGGADWLRFAQSLTNRQAEAAPQKPKPISNAASRTPSRPANRNSPVIQNSAAALLVSPQQSRKRAIVIEEDEDYIDAPEGEIDVFKRPTKQHGKSIISTPTPSAAKTNARCPVTSTIRTPVARAAKPKTGRSTKKRS